MVPPSAGTRSKPASLRETTTASVPSKRFNCKAAVITSASESARRWVASESSLRFGLMTVAPR